MATLALAVAGGFAANFAGIAPGFGVVAGAFAGQLLFGQDRPGGRDPGPKPREIMTHDSAQGLPIPIVYGSDRIGGIFAWTSGLKETTFEITSGGGGKL